MRPCWGGQAQRMGTKCFEADMPLYQAPTTGSRPPKGALCSIPQRRSTLGWTEGTYCHNIILLASCRPKTTPLVCLSMIRLRLTWVPEQNCAFAPAQPLFGAGSAQQVSGKKPSASCPGPQTEPFVVLSKELFSTLFASHCLCPTLWSRDFRTAFPFLAKKLSSLPEREQ